MKVEICKGYLWVVVVFQFPVGSKKHFDPHVNYFASEEEAKNYLEIMAKAGNHAELLELHARTTD